MIATLADVGQPLIAKIARQFGGWKGLKKILLALLDPLYSGSNNFPEFSDEQRWFAESYLPICLDDLPGAAIEQIGKVVQVYGLKQFLRILSAATPQTQTRLLALIIRCLPLCHAELMAGIP